jgi:enoyl-[acyl-carrier protein] reductase II
LEVPVINYSLGKGDWLAQRAHDYGGKVIATVTSVKHGKYSYFFYISKYIQLHSLTSCPSLFPPLTHLFTTKPAKSAQASGADALLVTGHEAAAHGGDVTSLVLVPAIASKVRIYAMYLLYNFHLPK